jgi:hypothetical protein
MADEPHPASEPDWLNPANDRKMPYTDGELDTLAANFIAMNSDTAAWRDLVAAVGEQQARQVVRQRLAAQDAKSLVIWLPEGPLH